MKNYTKKTPFYKTGTVDPAPGAKQPKAKVGEIPGLQEIKERFKGRYEVYPKKVDYDDDNVYWKGKKYPRSVMKEGAKNLPWEKEAYKNS